MLYWFRGHRINWATNARYQAVGWFRELRGKRREFTVEVDGRRVWPKQAELDL